jgi:hypothetical protein
LAKWYLDYRTEPATSQSSQPTTSQSNKPNAMIRPPLPDIIFDPDKHKHQRQCHNKGKSAKKTVQAYISNMMSVAT